MNQFQELQLNAADASVNQTTQAIYLANYNGFSYQAVMTGSPVGALKLQMSNDAGTITFGALSGTGVVNWTDITGSTFAVAAAGNWGWDYTLPGFRWVRLVYTASSGTGNISVTISVKG